MGSAAFVSSFRAIRFTCVTGLVATLALATAAHAQLSLGPLSPGSVTNDASFGVAAWTTPGNAAASDDSYAQAAPGGSPTQYLKATNFGFSIPAPAQIVGIEATIERRSASVMVKDARVRIVKGGVVGSAERADTVTLWPNTDTVASYGGSSDLWGETWTPADINGAGFGLALSAEDGVDLAVVDHMTLKVYYALCGNTPTGGCKTAMKSIFIVKDKTPDSKDKLIWKWIKGQPTNTADFADPLSTANYALCIYAGSTNALIADLLVPPGAGWSNISTKGFKYRDKTAPLPSGIQKVILKAHILDKSKALVKGKGDNLPTITPPLSLPVTVQLVNSDTGVCFEGMYDTLDLKKNQTGLFKAKAQ